MNVEHRTSNIDTQFLSDVVPVKFDGLGGQIQN